MLVVQRKQDLDQAAYLRQKIKITAYPSDCTVEKVSLRRELDKFI